ncbi:Chaperone protein [Arachis hypogaea]|nr:Chaperone protein [Arachis hypogaea]
MRMEENGRDEENSHAEREASLLSPNLASPPPPQELPPSVALRHYHRRLVVCASSSFKNCSFFFLDLGASVPGIHLLHRAPAAVRRALSHHRLRLVVADSSNPAPSFELCSSSGLCLCHHSAPLFSDCSEEKPISIPVSFLRYVVLIVLDFWLPIDLVDEAAPKLKMEITSKPTALDEINRLVVHGFCINLVQMEKDSSLQLSKRPQLLVALDFLLAVVEFFVPTVGNMLSYEEHNMSHMLEAVIMDQSIYGFNLTEASSEALIYVGSGKKLQFKNVVVKYLDSCVLLGANSSYSVSKEDNVYLKDFEESPSERSLRGNILDELYQSNAVNNSTELIIELQVKCCCSLVFVHSFM